MSLNIQQDTILSAKTLDWSGLTYHIRSFGTESKKTTSHRHLQHCLQSYKDIQSWKGLILMCFIIHRAGKLSENPITERRIDPPTLLNHK